MLLKWIEQCIPVQGATRTAIYDLNRSKVHLCPHDFAVLKDKIEGTIADGEAPSRPDERYWHEWSLRNEFFQPVPENCFSHFERLQIKWHNPSIIMTASVHVSNDLQHCHKILKSLGCNNITLIVESDDLLEDILTKYYTKTDLFSLDVCILKQINSDQDYSELIQQFPVLHRIYSPKKNTTDLDDGTTWFHPFHELSIGVFMEAQEFNLYLNRRIHVDANGIISNSPHSVKSMLNISDLTISNAEKTIIENTTITQNWTSKKDLTDVCDRCEFRYQCYDTRIPQYRESDGKWYHQSECTYNPFLGTSVGETGFVRLIEYGISSDEKCFSIANEPEPLTIY